MTKHCKSCDRILTIEHLITDKLGGYELRICLECIIAAFEEVLRESDALPEKPVFLFRGVLFFGRTLLLSSSFSFLSLNRSCFIFKSSLAASEAAYV